MQLKTKIKILNSDDESELVVALIATADKYYVSLINTCKVQSKQDMLLVTFEEIIKEISHQMQKARNIKAVNDVMMMVKSC